MAHPENDRTPDRYAAGYASTLGARWQGTLGDAVRRFAPAAWPGAPPEALVGFTTIGIRTADTGDPPVNNSFREIGYFQTEAGPNTGPSPNPDPTAPHNSWGRLARDVRVTSLLGRTATMVPGAWRDAVDDQTAVGLYNLADDADAVSRGVGGAGATSPGSLWRAVLGFSGFSAGVGGARNAVNRYASAVAAVPESARFAAWVQAILRDAAAGTLPGPVGNHGNPAYTALRTWQKLAAGRALAAQTGGDVAWFDTGFGAGEPAAQQALADAAYRRSVTSVPGFDMPGGVGTLLGAILIAGGAYAAYHYWTTRPVARRR